MPASYSSAGRSANRAADTRYAASPWADWAAEYERREAAPNGKNNARSAAAPRDESDAAARNALMDCYNG